MKKEAQTERAMVQTESLQRNEQYVFEGKHQGIYSRGYFHNCSHRGTYVWEHPSSLGGRPNRFYYPYDIPKQ